eukprot:1964627-Rhodomonas_salina.1
MGLKAGTDGNMLVQQIISQMLCLLLRHGCVVIMHKDMSWAYGAWNVASLGHERNGVAGAGAVGGAVSKLESIESRLGDCTVLLHYLSHWPADHSVSTV